MKVIYEPMIGLDISEAAWHMVSMQRITHCDIFCKFNNVNLFLDMNDKTTMPQDLVEQYWNADKMNRKNSDPVNK
jgi:hypothetical protein